MSTPDRLSTEERLFVSLLTAALHHEEVNPTPFVGLTATEWSRIHRLAAAHAVSAFVGDRILTLPAEALPERTLRLQIFSEIELTKRSGDQLAAALLRLDKLYRHEGLHFALLKGLGLGQYYPEPGLRTGGDLDLLLLSDADYERANALLVSRGLHLHEESEVRYGHTTFSYGRIVIENHARAVFFETPRYNERFEQELRGAIEAGALVNIDIHGRQIQTLPHELNAVYVFIHFFFHWLHWGVGFRQWCDWLLLLRATHTKLSRDRFTELATSLDILYPMQLFAAASVRYLGVDAGIFPFPLLTGDDPHIDEVFSDVLGSGNFGFSKRPERSRNPIINTWRKLRFKLQRTHHLRSITPEHTRGLLRGTIIGHLQLRLRRRH